MGDRAESWKAVVGFEGYYEVSDRGRVRSLGWMVPLGDRMVQRKGRLLKPQAKDTGHLWVWLCKDKVRNRKKIHHLVLEAFDQPRPSGLWGLHKDDNPANNSWPENLYWGTPTQNTKDRRGNGNSPNVNKTKCPNGHDYAGPDGRVNRAGGRYCLACMRSKYHNIRKLK